MVFNDIAKLGSGSYQIKNWFALESYIRLLQYDFYFEYSFIIIRKYYRFFFLFQRRDSQLFRKSLRRYVLRWRRQNAQYFTRFTEIHIEPSNHIASL